MMEELAGYLKLRKCNPENYGFKRFLEVLCVVDIITFMYNIICAECSIRHILPGCCKRQCR